MRSYISANSIIIGSDNGGLSPLRLQTITWTNTELLLVGNFTTNCREILIKIQKFSFKKMHFKTLPGLYMYLRVLKTGVLIIQQQNVTEQGVVELPG